MRIAVVADRHFYNFRSVEYYIKGLPENTTVVSRDSTPIEKLAERIARERGLATDLFFADPRTYGESADLIRDQRIVNNADMIVAFGSDPSRDTINVIKFAKQVGLKLTVFSE